MFGWFKRRREEALLREFLPALAQGEKYRPIREALKAIGVEDKETEPSAFTAIAAASLSLQLCRLAEADLTNDDDVFVGGMFALVTSDYIANRVGAQFEVSASLSLLEFAGSKTEFERIHNPITSAYNAQVSEMSPQLQAIGSTVAKWMHYPTDENLARLVKLFQLHRQHVSAPPA
jgi:hypothetical protein